MNLTTSAAPDLLARYGLRLDDPTAQVLVRRWYAAARALSGYVETVIGERVDVGDASTLAEMFVEESERR
jgi:hypothetical protein